MLLLSPRIPLGRACSVKLTPIQRERRRSGSQHPGDSLVRSRAHTRDGRECRRGRWPSHCSWSATPATFSTWVRRLPQASAEQQPRGRDWCRREPVTADAPATIAFAVHVSPSVTSASASFRSCGRVAVQRALVPSELFPGHQPSAKRGGPPRAPRGRAYRATERVRSGAVLRARQW
jgi:hypothetical protein